MTFTFKVIQFVLEIFICVILTFIDIIGDRVIVDCVTSAQSSRRDRWENGAARLTNVAQHDDPWGIALALRLY